MSDRALRRDDHPAAAGAGSALPVLLVHGAVQTRAVWAAQVEALAGSRRIVVPDLAGHGETPLGEAPLTIGGMAEDVLRLMDDLGLERAAVCGVSLGGMVALDMAARAPERIAGLVLANTPRSLTALPWLRKSLAALDPQRLLFPIFRLIGRERSARAGLALARVLVGPQWVGRTARHHFIKGFATMPDEAIVATYGAIVDYHPVDPARIRCPTLVVEGAEDAGSIRSQGRDLAGRLRRARRIVLDVGHVAQLDDPAAFNERLIAFLASLESGPEGEPIGRVSSN
ncbi:MULTISPECIES: alpha/beta fold hydrolase [unclassified Aureimonas]|uniref:alpha/beta fold hydrolase n=1 Tax=unclassified Aureimonas TaxID=2615206 RepID=UPI0006F72413|nr:MULTISPECIES: alpha/beta fold hydrolase [unclassified Aureimonas]KQT60703.1 alpha/beta hydrolase [Aureimonas sp. Leaf460]KQT68832.1 alpha/beta hydrolase [Aureimonas sp. Leaf427]